MMEVHDYTFLFGIGLFFAFMDAYGIGANDVANSFATSVGSGSITLAQALIIACFCEFGGAFLLGANTTETIKGGIVQTSMYTTQPEILMNSFRRGLIAIPAYFGIALTVNVFYIIFKGAPNTKLKADSNIGIAVGIALGVGALVFLWCFFFLRPFLRRRIQDKEDLRWFHIFYVPFVSPREKITPSQEEAGQKSEKSADGTDADSSDAKADPSLVQLESKEKSFGQKFKGALTHGLTQEVNITHDEGTNAVHENATKFDRDTERLFSAVQVITACFTSFAHGSNDVANAIGPLATIYHIWEHASFDSKASVPVWILAFGGVAIDLGLMTYGYHVMRTLGNKMTYMSPTRGFSAEMGTSITILTCSKLGLPVSSTHCITGATSAIGLMSGGGFKSLNWRLLIGVFAGWIATLPAAGVVSGVIFAFVSRSPMLTA
ncbi:Na+/Pi symporter [Mortierella sp. GBA35]|nr:Na+/Pi symporter [Mortierella sp. GBA35]